MHDIKKKNKYKNSKNNNDYWKGYLKAKPNTNSCIFCAVDLTNIKCNLACNNCWKERGL